MSAGRIILGGTILGAAWIVWSNQARADQEREAQIWQASQPVQPVTKTNKLQQFAPLLEWGLGALMNRNSSSNTTTNTGQTAAPTFNLAGLLGGFSNAQASPQGAGAGTAGLLGLIGSIEAPQGYDQVYGGSRLQPPRPLSTMTVGEVLDWQSRSVAAGSASSAAGRYQIIRPTLSGLVSQGAVSRDQLFDRATQDRLANVLLERRGLSSYQSGQISAETFANRLAQEWASLPVVTGSKAGSSYYSGDGLNKALTTPDRVLSQIKTL